MRAPPSRGPPLRSAGTRSARCTSIDTCGKGPIASFHLGHTIEIGHIDQVTGFRRFPTLPTKNDFAHGNSPGKRQTCSIASASRGRLDLAQAPGSADSPTGHRSEKSVRPATQRHLIYRNAAVDGPTYSPVQLHRGLP